MKKSNLISVFEYLVLAFGMPLICVLLCHISWIKNNDALFLALYGIEAASPTLAVVILIFMRNKKIGLYTYLNEKFLYNFSLKKCAFGFLVPFLILSCAKIFIMSFDPTQVLISSISPKKVMIISWALISEELGWRGFLQDKLESLLSYKYIPLVTGIIWALWHYHFMFSGSMNVPIFAFTMGCIFESFGYFTLQKISKNNIVPVCIWHFTGNFMFNLYGFDPQLHNGNLTFFGISTAFYSINILLFWAYVKKTNN